MAELKRALTALRPQSKFIVTVRLQTTRFLVSVRQHFNLRPAAAALNPIAGLCWDESAGS